MDNTGYLNELTAQWGTKQITEPGEITGEFFGFSVAEDTVISAVYAGSKNVTYELIDNPGQPFMQGEVHRTAGGLITKIVLVSGVIIVYNKREV